METDVVKEFGLWEDKALQDTAAEFGGDGSDHDIEPIQRFGRSICRLALRRLSEPENSVRRDAIAIFLLQSIAPSGQKVVREPLLGDGSVEICGKIWFANVTVQSGRCLDVDCVEDGAMFDKVEALGLGTVPAVVFNPKVAVPIVRIYAQGIGVEDDVEAIEIDDHDVSLKEIRDIIDLMCEKELCTPGAQQPGLSMWAKASKCWAASNAEAIAQLCTKTALSVRLFSCDIRREQTMRVGRTDLEIVQKFRHGKTVTWAELEIKVLRERNRNGKKWSDNWVERWMRKGIMQATAYRDEREAEFGMLCCFDMRQEDRGDLIAFANVKDYATENDITLHRNFLYSSAEAWQVANYGS